MNLFPSSVIGTIVKILYTIAIIFSFPLTAYPGIHIIEPLFIPRRQPFSSIRRKYKKLRLGKSKTMKNNLLISPATTGNITSFIKYDEANSKEIKINQNIGIDIKDEVEPLLSKNNNSMIKKRLNQQDSQYSLSSQSKRLLQSNTPKVNSNTSSANISRSTSKINLTSTSNTTTSRSHRKKVPRITGKESLVIKWMKNVFRIFYVMVLGIIAYCGSTNLDNFVSLIGSLACIPLMFVYPALMHYRGIASSFGQKITDVFIITFGVVATVWITGISIQGWV